MTGVYRAYVDALFLPFLQISSSWIINQTTKFIKTLLNGKSENISNN